MSARLGWTLYIVSVLKSPSVPHTGARDIILYIYILEHVERMSALFASVLCAFRGVQKAGKRMALPTGILAGLSCSMPSFADFNAALQTYCHDMAFFCVFFFFLGGGINTTASLRWHTHARCPAVYAQAIPEAEKRRKAQAELDKLNKKYGRMSSKDLKTKKKSKKKGKKKKKKAKKGGHQKKDEL